MPETVTNPRKRVRSFLETSGKPREMALITDSLESTETPKNSRAVTAARTFRACIVDPSLSQLQPLSERISMRSIPSAHGVEFLGAKRSVRTTHHRHSSIISSTKRCTVFAPSRSWVLSSIPRVDRETSWSR
jgi:hypothetical protein